MAAGPDRTPEQQAAWNRLFAESRSLRGRLLEDMLRAGINPGPRGSGLLAFAKTPRGQEISRQVSRDFSDQPEPTTPTTLSKPQTQA